MNEKDSPLGTPTLGGLKTELLTPEDIPRAGEIIRRGGLVAFPTETVYGLGASALDADAAAKIYAAKGRPSDNPLIVHLAYPDEAERYAVTSPIYYLLAEHFMPGPLTVILPRRDIIPKTVTGGLDSVALRVPVDVNAHKLIKCAGVPIAAPSANLSGSPSPTTAAHCVADLTGRVDAIIDGGESSFGLESTIVRPEDGGHTLRLLRPGAITPDDLRAVCENIVIDPAVTERFDGVPAAPGMKYRHYAPSAPVVILDGGDREVYDYVRIRAAGCGVLCFDEDAELLSLPDALSYGAKGDPRAQAHRLFSCLRSYRGVNTIYARMPSREGMGLAVFNRLIKAAGYTVVKL